ncbi:putative apoptosis-inducing factor [Xylariales sp. PMI_506]|nr:putative apoptosis-inducing factor [Xylariales sp. PMI_506]
MKHIVVVGGSYAAVSTAHRILKHAKSPTHPFKLTLVSRDTHFYWNIASPIALATEDFPDEKLFQPIAQGFSHYQADEFEFLLGTATSLDDESKQLTVSQSDGKGTTKLHYDLLILGTGTSTKGNTPLKSKGSTEATKEALHEYYAKIKASKTILVAGAGPTGVEIAGELGAVYGSSKEIILITTGSRVLSGAKVPTHVSKAAEQMLRALKVDVRVNTEITAEKELPGGRTEIVLSSNDKLIVDMSIPTFGVQPNTSYLPTAFLDKNGYIDVDEFLAVKGAKSVFAIGEVSNIEHAQYFTIESQSKHLTKNVTLILDGKAPLPYKISSMAMMGVRIGNRTGTGFLGRFKLPSFMVTMLRKTLFMDWLPKTVDGSMF